MSTENIDYCDLGSDYDLGSDLDEADIDKAVNDWLNGVAKLDELCAPYGKGKSATGARSIRVEDINKITGYNTETAKYGEGELYEYGNKIEYSYAGEGKIKLTSTNSKESSIVSRDKFYYIDKKLVEIDLTKSEGSIITLMSNAYQYYMSSDNKANLMLFGEYDEEEEYYTAYYCLASPYIRLSGVGVEYGMRSVQAGMVACDYLLHLPSCETLTAEKGVRAVVKLSSNIQLTGSSEIGWSY